MKCNRMNEIKLTFLNVLKENGKTKLNVNNFVCEFFEKKIINYFITT